MIDAKDLMLGDWVAISKSAEDGLIYAHEKESHGRDYFCITGFSSSIGYDENIVHYEIPSIYNCTCISGIHCKYIEPIRLTEDILVNNCGFERKQHLYSNRFILGDFEIERQGKKYAYVIWGNEDAPFLTHYIGHCEYLHELQRLYKVIQKKELEVKL